MIKAEVERWGRYIVEYLETGEVILYSVLSYGGDGGLQWFSNAGEAKEVLSALGLKRDSMMREPGTGEIEEVFVEKIRLAPGHKYYPLGGPWPDVAIIAANRDRSKDN